MNILQLCCFTNHWGSDCFVESIDLSKGRDVMYLPWDYARGFDFVLAAPPCTQFTKANWQNWVEYPSYDIAVAEKCLSLCLASNAKWVFENPPGRIEKLIPVLKQYRVLTLFDKVTNKEWVLYSNLLLLNPGLKRYGRSSISNLTKHNRLAYPKWFVQYLAANLGLSVD